MWTIVRVSSYQTFGTLQSNHIHAFPLEKWYLLRFVQKHKIKYESSTIGENTSSVSTSIIYCLNLLSNLDHVPIIIHPKLEAEGYKRTFKSPKRKNISQSKTNHRIG